MTRFETTAANIYPGTVLDTEVGPRTVLKAEFLKDRKLMRFTFADLSMERGAYTLVSVVR